MQNNQNQSVDFIVKEKPDDACVPSVFKLEACSHKTFLPRREFCIGLAASTLVPLTASSKTEETVSPKKRTLGQYFTQKRCWLLPQVKKFIAESGCSIVYDPFAGSGCLIKAVQEEVATIHDTKGLDIDSSLGWERNDSLVKIPHIPAAIIVTNPPYISNYSARRKKLNSELEKYFKSTEYDDVYLLALDKMLEAQKHVVAIVPETFINSPYKQKNKLSSITILENNPFEDTDTPVVVLCFDSEEKPYDKIGIYKDGESVCTLGEVERCRARPTNCVRMKFNDPNGWLAVRCVDTTDPACRIHFAYKHEIDYNWDKGLKGSSRLLTLVGIDVPPEKRDCFIQECNKILERMREQSHDIIFSPFKGNMKNGVRRRRLDYLTCRAIIEEAFAKVVAEKKIVQTVFL